MFCVFDNVIDIQKCAELISLAPDVNKIETIMPLTPKWDDRVININQHPIVEYVEAFLSITFKQHFKAYNTELQLWPPGAHAPMHIHNSPFRLNNGTQRNSMLYLNNDFEGGEFTTDDIVVIPKPGRLTLFNGSNVRHGVNKVLKKPRFTIIFWW
jgi:hypothetical protein